MLFKKIKKIESLNNSEDLYNNIISFVKEKKKLIFQNYKDISNLNI